MVRTAFRLTGGNPQNRRRISGLVSLCALFLVLPACTVVSISDDRQARARQSEGFDAATYVTEIWLDKIVPAFEAAPPLGEVLLAADTDLATAGKRFGRQAGEGSPWTFAVRGNGVVKAIDRKSRAGSITLTVETKAGPREIWLQSGPVVSGSALRDSQGFITFNDFTNQVAFAGVSRELNKKALTLSSATLTGLEPGDRVDFSGAFSLAAASAPVRIVPVTLKVAR